ncbi:N-acetyltransferase family protein [Ochrobactrum teleogrylli]
MQHSEDIERPLCVLSDARRSMAGEFVFMAELAVRAWEIPAKSEPLGDHRRAELEANFLGYLHENADGVLVAELDGKILGWGARVAGSNYIADLWIDPPYHGQGIGGRILDALMAQILLDGFDSATIGTHADNLPAIGLYEKMGFRIEWRGEEASVSMGRVVEKVRMRATL